MSFMDDARKRAEEIRAGDSPRHPWAWRLGLLIGRVLRALRR